MQYLIIEETQYEHTDNTYHIEDCTNDYRTCSGNYKIRFS